jgi:hypothetical protein
MGSQTPNYKLNKPDIKSGDLMSDYNTWLNSNWTTLQSATGPEGSGTSLPTSGVYNLGDRFYKTDTKSIYILICKDADWGWYWRPIHDAISPWVTVPDTAMNLAGWGLNVVPAKPMQIAFDNRGECYWRGIIGVTSGTIPRGVSHAVFKLLPQGLRPRERGAYMLGHETLAVGTDGTSLTSYQGARIFISEDPTANPTVRCFGGTAEFNRVHFGGAVQYASGTGIYTAV